MGRVSDGWQVQYFKSVVGTGESRAWRSQADLCCRMGLRPYFSNVQDSAESRQLRSSGMDGGGLEAMRAPMASAASPAMAGLRLVERELARQTLCFC